MSKYNDGYKIIRPFRKGDNCHIRFANLFILDYGMSEIIGKANVIPKTQLEVEIEAIRSENYQLINGTKFDGTVDTIVVKQMREFKASLEISLSNSVYCKDNYFEFIPKNKTKDYPKPYIIKSWILDLERQIKKLQEEILYLENNELISALKRLKILENKMIGENKNELRKFYIARNNIIKFHYPMMSYLAKKYISIYGLDGRVEFTDLVHEGICFMSDNRTFLKWIEKAKQIMYWSFCYKKIQQVMLSPLSAFKGYELFEEGQEYLLADLDYMFSPEQSETYLLILDSIGEQQSKLLSDYISGKLKGKHKRVQREGKKLFQDVTKMLRQ